MIAIIPAYKGAKRAVACQEKQGSQNSIFVAIFWLVVLAPRALLKRSIYYRGSILQEVDTEVYIPLSVLPSRQPVMTSWPKEGGYRKRD